MKALPPPPKPASAFSLIEVTLALGITAFAVIPLIGLMSVGLIATRSNIERSVKAQILGWVQGDVRLQTAPYAARFDEQGSATTDTTAPWVAQITPRSIRLPGGSLSVSAWNVEILHQPRNQQRVEEKVVWDSL